MAAKGLTSNLFKAFGFGSSAKVENHADGGTIANYDGGGKVDAKNRAIPSKFSSLLKKGSSSVRAALSREGAKGVLAVFTPGEEVLSLKTGEAQRYQALKAKIGYNPLARLQNFALGGTVDIEGNLLGNLNRSYSSPQLQFQPPKAATTNNYRANPSLTINVTTPNADSFRKCESQLGLEAAELYRRSLLRNG